MKMNNLNHLSKKDWIEYFTQHMNADRKEKPEENATANQKKWKQVCIYTEREREEFRILQRRWCRGKRRGKRGGFWEGFFRWLMWWSVEWGSGAASIRAPCRCILPPFWGRMSCSDLRWSHSRRPWWARRRPSQREGRQKDPFFGAMRDRSGIDSKDRTAATTSSSSPSSSSS